MHLSAKYGTLFLFGIVMAIPPQPTMAFQQPQLQTGHLVVRGDADGILLIDGKEAGPITDGGYLNLDISTGEHFVELRVKDSACRWEKKIVVPPGMQVAESTEFRSACRAGTPGASLPSSTPPPAALPSKPSETDSEHQARELHERGCLLAGLERFHEAIEVLEKAENVGPPLDHSCHDIAQNGLKHAQEQLQKCETPAPVAQVATNGKKVKKVKQPKSHGCEVYVAQYGYSVGDYVRAQQAANAIIETTAGSDQYTSANRANMNATYYRQRALIRFALGDPIPALSDLQSTTEWETGESFTGSHHKTYYYRAAILAHLGNTQEAASNCSVAFTFQYAELLPVDSLMHQFCTRLIAESTGLAGPTPGSSALSASPSTTLRSEVEEVERSGRFIALPPPQVTRTQITGVSSGLTLDARRVVRNGTGYQLRVVFTGPVDREIALEPGASQTIILKPGQYTVLGRVSAPDVLPFLGQQSYNSGETYTSQFVIQ